MAQMNDFELVVSEGKRPIWKSILSAACFTVMVIWLLADISALFEFEITENLGLHLAEDLKGIMYFFAGGVCFGLQKDILFLIYSNKMIKKYNIVIFTKRKITKAPDIEYVAVFKNAKEQFEVNLWYKGNKHYKMYVFDEKKAAMDFAEHVADKLKIDHLDATEKGNSKWIEKTLANE
jgi:hypothetical protein